MRIVFGLVAAACSLLSFCLIAPFCHPTDRPQATRSSLEFLRTVDGFGMQRLFPEGELLTAALPALAAANLERRGQLPREDADELLRGALDVVNSDRVRDRFGRIPSLEGGTFYRGWRLLLEVELLRMHPEFLPEVRRDASQIQEALAFAPGIPDSYPGQYWPCDAVVATAALERLKAVSPAALPNDYLPFIELRLRDMAIDGLLPHRVDASGRSLEGPRATSSSLIATFLPDLSREWAGQHYRDFIRAFVTSKAGLTGVTEYPHGASGGSDVDTGPLVFGVSASASAVTLAAARRMDDEPLARTLDAECDLLGFPIDVGTGRRHWFGAIPVGDAFVAWARSQDRPAEPVGRLPSSPASWVWLYGLAALLPAAAAVWALWRTSPARRHQRG